MNNTQDALRLALAAIEQFQKDLYAVPNFADRVNKATRDALHQAHLNILALPARIDAALSAAPASEQQPVTEIKDTYTAREFLVEWHRTHMDEHPFFSAYIREQLAGDFAYQLARALLAQQAADSEQQPMTDGMKAKAEATRKELQRIKDGPQDDEERALKSQILDGMSDPKLWEDGVAVMACYGAQEFAKGFRAALSQQAAADPMPKWIDDAKGKDPFIDDLIAEIERLRLAPVQPVQQEAQENCNG